MAAVTPICPNRLPTLLLFTARRSSLLGFIWAMTTSLKWPLPAMSPSFRSSSGICQQFTPKSVAWELEEDTLGFEGKVKEREKWNNDGQMWKQKNGLVGGGGLGKRKVNVNSGQKGKHSEEEVGIDGSTAVKRKKKRERLREREREGRTKIVALGLSNKSHWENCVVSGVDQWWMDSIHDCFYPLLEIHTCTPACLTRNFLLDIDASVGRRTSSRRFLFCLTATSIMIKMAIAIDTDEAPTVV